jgi:glycine betaine catabolism A
VNPVERTLAEHRAGHSLPQALYLDTAVYAHELETIWRRSWLFAGLSVQARTPGHFFRFTLGDDSILIVRGEDGALCALHNTCRHRGMRVCDSDSCSAKRWVCPYHQWSYALDGTLIGAGGMEREVDLADHGLLRAPVIEVGRAGGDAGESLLAGRSGRRGGT